MFYIPLSTLLLLNGYLPIDELGMSQKRLVFINKFKMVLLQVTLLKGFGVVFD